MPRKKKIDSPAESEDQRPPARPRKHPQLWQAYLLWDELMRQHQRHVLRIDAINKGKSNLDALFEQNTIDDLGMEARVNKAKKMMIDYGKMTGPIWAWVTGVKGLKAGGEAAKLIAQIDDIARFDTIAKLWRFAGMAVIDGKAERGALGEKSHYNRQLKSICFGIADQFIRHQTPGYVEIYYAEKQRLRLLHPEPVKVDKRVDFTDQHIHTRAWRKMIKKFLADLWVEWRLSEGLPTGAPWANSKR